MMTKQDWQWVLLAAQERWRRSDPKPGEPPASRAYKAEKARVFSALYALAYPKEG
jgi:hypothetical protein